MARFFPIIMWMEANPGKMGFNQNTAADFFKKSCSDIASLNCNTIRPSNLPFEYVDRLCAAAAEHELKVILDPQYGHSLMDLTPTEIVKSWASKKTEIKANFIDRFAHYKNLLGYAISDEPPLDKIEQWKLILKMFKELDPAHPDYTCFNRPPVLAEVVNDNSVSLENIVYDNYPHEQSLPLNTMGTHPDFGWYNLYRAFYNICKARLQVPQVSTVAVFKNDNPWRKPTPNEFLTTVYTSLAAGAKGIMFFVYMDIKGDSEAVEGLVDSNWQPYPLYHTVKTAAAELKRLGSTVSEFQPLSDVTGWDPAERTLNSTYQHANGNKYFIIANKDPHPDHGTIGGNLRLPGPLYLEDIETKEVFQADNQGMVTIPLAPASGRVLQEKSGPRPFGSFDLPQENSINLAGAVAVTGWALDDRGIEGVEIKRSPFPGDPEIVIGKDGLVFIGQALFVEGARPDIAARYPHYPNSQKAGWGYMLLSNFLPNRGNGTFVLYAIAYDLDGNSTVLGQKTITCNNAASRLPLGTIDTPAPGETVSGRQYKNWGWVLTPPPNWIPYDGKTITVFIDNQPIGNPTYGIQREDINSLFPECLNNQQGHGSVGYRLLDTTKYPNGLHTIAWVATDSAGSQQGIGSRFFWIKN